MPATPDSCSTCFAFVNGECHWLPPVLPSLAHVRAAHPDSGSKENELLLIGTWPKVSADGWCGQFKKK